MWQLQAIDGGVTYRLLTGKEYIVGRKDCDIVIEGDKSISRKHAVLTIEYSETKVLNVKRLPVLHLQDFSKFGTTVNNVKVKEKRMLIDSDTIKFGGIFSKWKVKFEPFAVSTSSLNTTSKKQVQSLLCRLGGHLVSLWQENNNYLIMSNLLLTVKAVCALICGKHIVTPNYLEELVQSILNNSDAPTPDDFCPRLGEAIISESEIDFTPLEKRKTLFENKKFLFSSEKQLKKLEIPIRLGGGEVFYHSSVPNSKLLLLKGVCVLSLPENSEDRLWLPTAMEILKRHSKRVIRESEIGMAVVFCSTEKYCNPDFDLVTTVFDQLQPSTQTQSMVEIYAPDSQKSSFLLGTGGSSKTITSTADLFSKQSKVSETISSRSNVNVLESLDKGSCSRSRKHLLDDNLHDLQNISQPAKIPKIETLDEDDLFPVAEPQQQTVTFESIGKVENQAEMEVDDYCVPTESQATIPFVDDDDEVVVIPKIPPTTIRNGLPNPSTRTEINNKQTPSTSAESEMLNDSNNNNCTVIEIQDLIKRSKIIRLASTLSGKNFKKFKKVQHLKTSVLPQVIGGRDLQEYVANGDDVTGWTQEMNFLTTDHGTQEEDLFDWAPKRGGRGLRGR